MRLAPGMHVGPYEILAAVGAGGMGEVYRAHDPRLARDVALKILPMHLARDPDALARFEREARAVAALSHPNILAIYDVGTHEGASYAVTELLEGETLRSRMDHSPFKWTKAAEIGMAIADGVAAAHARSIIHRDLKPGNVFLTSDGRVKILDFGLARVRAAPSLNLASAAQAETLPGVILGTIGYMSPEQVRGEATETTSDIFSLGCMLYEMVAGRGPFARETGIKTMSAILDSDPPQLADSGSDAPPEFDRLISRCLEKDPVLRMQSARDLSFALGELLKGAVEARAKITRHEQAGSRESRLRESRPVNPEAYESFLRARYLSVRTTDTDSQAAIVLLESAVALDPGFAASHAALAAAYVNRLAFVAPEQTGELEQKAYAAAERALSLDPEVAEAYLARGDLLWTPTHRFAHERAAQEYRRALSLNPNLDHAHRGLARVYVHVGFFEEALQHAAKALETNPTNAHALNSRAEALLWMGRDEEALATLSSIPRVVVPELVEAHIIWTLSRLGKLEEAWSRLRQALREYPNDASGVLRSLEAMLLADSEPRKAEELIRKIAKRKAVNPSHHAAHFAACAWARMGDAQEAVRWLREAAETGFPCRPLFERDSNLDPIHHDPRFQAFLADMQKQSESLRKALFPDRR